MLNGIGISGAALSEVALSETALNGIAFSGAALNAIHSNSNLKPRNTISSQKKMVKKGVMETNV